MHRFSDMVDRALHILERRGRVSISALRLDLDVDDNVASAIRDELVDVLEIAEEPTEGVLALRGWAGPKEASAPTASPERRQLTVLFCDLVSSTSLAESLDPELLSALMARYQGICNDVIGRFDGHVSQWVGDGVDVYFGYPRAHEEDAERAVRCGLAIVDAITAAARSPVLEEFGVSLEVRVGINTGTAVVGSTALDSRGGTLAFGDTPNIAARIQTLAAPGTVAVGERTHALVGDEFEFEPLGAHRLKGISKPVEVFRAVRPIEGRARFEAAASRGLTALVDREQERAALRGVCERVALGDGQAILLRGEPGIGKSRLVAAVRSTLIGDWQFEFVDCQCSPLYSDSALHPIVDGLRRHLRVGHPEGEDRLREAAGDPRTVALLASALAAPLPSGIAPIDAASPQRLRRETLGALASFFFEVAGRSPLALVVEDLHWVDPSTLELLGTLIEGRPGSRLLVLLTARPEFAHPWPEALATHEVGRLPADATRELIEAAGGGAFSGEVAQQMADRADGIPLFAEELTRALSAAPPADEDEVPTTLYGCLMARLDRDPRARSVAQLASIVGREFELGLLEAVGELDQETLREGLERLIEDELVARAGRDRCVFRHVLIADAARGSLLRDVRRRYHRRIADTLTEQFGELAAQQPERVARHYEWAGAFPEAVMGWQTTGLAALQRFANQEASACFERALTLVPQIPDERRRSALELSLHVLAALPLVATRGWTAREVLAHYERAEQLCEVVEGAPQLFPTMLGLVTYRLVSGQLEEAVALGADQIEIAESTRDEELVLEAQCEVGNALAYLGQFEESRARLTKVAEFYDPARHHHHTLMFGRDPGAIALAHLALGSVCTGELDRALAEMHTALELVTRWPHPFSEAWVRVCAAEIHLFRDEVDDARREAEAAIALARSEGFPNWEAQARVCRGWALVAQGSYDVGLEDARAGVAMWELGGAVLMRPHLLGLLGDALRRAGRLDESETILTAALGWAEQSGERWAVPEVHCFTAELEHARGNTAGMRAAAERATECAREIGALGFERRAAGMLRKFSSSTA